MPPPRSAPVLMWALSIKLAVALLLVLAAGRMQAQPGLTAPREPGAPDAAWVLARGFDANIYVRMAREGWYDDVSRCFPLGYPLAIRALLPLTGSAQTAAVLVANLASLLALVVFHRLARHYARGDERLAALATILFACLPGVLAFGTVAYSEGLWVLVTLLAWSAWLRAESPAGTARRHVGWLVLAAALAALSVQVRHAGLAFVAGLALVELLRALRSTRRAWGEAALVWAVAVLPTLAYFAWQDRAHDFMALQRELFDSRFVPFAAPFSLLASGAPPENVAVLFATFPLALALLVRLRDVDRRLFVVCAVQLAFALSCTGMAAQSVNRFVWALGPLALGALAVRDRVLLLGACGVLFCASLWCGLGNVLGTAAL